MGKMKYSMKLLREITQFSQDNKTYWLVPLFLLLLLGSLLIVGGQAVAPLIYALF
jgi:hypothetical protein